MKTGKAKADFPARIALVHDFLLGEGGAEKVLLTLAQDYPQADIFGLLADRGWLSKHKINSRTYYSFLGKLPRALQRRRRLWLPLLPLAAEMLDLSGYEMVISNTSSFAKGIITRPATLHLCYCHTPTRFLWETETAAGKHLGRWRGGFWRLGAHLLRMWDQAAAARVDYFIANSYYTRERIRHYYRREAVVIYPPVEIYPFLQAAQQAQASPRAKRPFVVLGRLVESKNVALAIAAFNKLELPLAIVGVGPAQRRLKKLAGKTVSFRGYVEKDKLPQLLANARALVVPAAEDFGLQIVEALAAGIPVLALRRGGAREIVEEGKHGLFFEEPQEEFLAMAVRRFLEWEKHWQPEYGKRRARQFTPEIFRRNWQRIVTAAWQEWREGKKTEKGQKPSTI
jgi:glycosyltransferase involved in cell wall biosynthesis